MDIKNLGTWRPISDLPADSKQPIIAWPSRGGWADEIVIISVAAAKAHNMLYWQPLPSVEVLKTGDSK